MVGNVEAPAKANIMDPKAELIVGKELFQKKPEPLKNPLTVGGGKSLSLISVPSITQVETMRTQATMVVIRAPTAIGQKSLGVPIQVRGVRPPATMTIQTQRERWKPAAAQRDPSSWEMRTMKTQPPPYRVRVMQMTEMTLQQVIM